MALSIPVTEVTLRVGDSPFPHHLPPLSSPELRVLSTIAEQQLKYEDDSSELVSKNRNRRRFAYTRRRRSRRNRRRNPNQQVGYRRRVISEGETYRRDEVRGSGNSHARIMTRGSDPLESGSQKHPRIETSTIHTAVPNVKRKSKVVSTLNNTPQLDKRSGSLPVNLPQQLLLTPVGPFQWQEMVSDTKTPHFLLVPTTPIKATWLKDSQSSDSKFGESEIKPLPLDHRGGHTSHAINEYEQVAPYDTVGQQILKTDDHKNTREHSNMPYHVPSVHEHFFQESSLEAKDQLHLNRELPENKQHRVQQTQDYFQENERRHDFGIHQNTGQTHFEIHKNTRQPHFDNHENSGRTHFNVQRDESAGQKIGGQPHLVDRSLNRGIDNSGGSGSFTAIDKNHRDDSFIRHLDYNRRESPNGFLVIRKESPRVTVSHEIRIRNDNSHSSTFFTPPTLAGIHIHGDQQAQGNNLPINFQSSPHALDQVNEGSNQNSGFHSEVRIYDISVRDEGATDETQSLQSKNEFSPSERDLENRRWDASKFVHAAERPSVTNGQNLGSNGDESSNVHVSDNKNILLINSDEATKNLPNLKRRDNVHNMFIPSQPNLITTDGTRKIIITEEYNDRENIENGIHNINSDHRAEYAPPMTKNVPRSEESHDFRKFQLPTAPQYEPIETGMRRLENRFNEQDNFTNDRIIDNKSLTTRYSKRQYETTLENIASKTPQNIVTFQNNRRMDNSQDLKLFDTKPPTINPTSFQIQNFRHSEVSGNNGLFWTPKPKLSVHSASHAGFRTTNLNKEEPPERAKYEFTARDAVTKIRFPTTQQSQRGDRRIENSVKPNYRPSTTLGSKAPRVHNSHFSHETVVNSRNTEQNNNSSFEKTYNPEARDVNLGGPQDVYQSASNMHSVKLQNFQYDGANLFAALRSLPTLSPVTYIEYTTLPTITEETSNNNFGSKPQTLYNPFISNFGPFPSLDGSKNKIGGSASNKHTVYVTPHPPEASSDLHNATIASYNRTTEEGKMKYPDAVYFIPMSENSTRSVPENSNLSVSKIDYDSKVKQSNNLESLHVAVQNNTSEEKNNIQNAISSITESLLRVDDVEQISDTSKLEKDGATEDELVVNLKTADGIKQYTYHERRQPVHRLKSTSYASINSTEAASSSNANTTLENLGDASVNETLGFANDGEEGRAHRTGGDFLDALVTIVRQASNDRHSLREMLPPFSVMEVGVGESLSTSNVPTVTSYNSTTLQLEDTSGFSSMVQLGIILGIVILAAVMLFHTPRLRKEIFSKERRERLRRLKRRYADENISVSSIEFSSVGGSKYATDQRQRKDRESQGDRSDGESHYARVLDVNL